MRLTPLLLLLGCTANITAPELDGSVADTGTASDTIVEDDSSGDTGEDSQTDTDTEPAPEPVDYTVTGPHAVSSRSQNIQASCTMQTLIFTPDSASAPLIVLAHGFARSADQLTGWAEHLASWGFTVAVPSLCHSSFWDADHEANGGDLTAIPDALGVSQVIYGGHSAGGLAALDAGALDARTLGVIGLDATDSDGIGVGYARSLSAPALGLLGEPSDCNADNNGAALYQTAADSLAVRVTDADHCDYESDTDWMCTSFCTNSAASFSDSDIQTSIRGLMTAAAFEITDGETGWWESGSFYEELVSSGRLTPL